MHSLNSMAGIKRYRIQDDVPLTISGEAAGAETPSGGELDNGTLKPAAQSWVVVTMACATLVRMMSRIFRSSR